MLVVLRLHPKGLGSPEPMAGNQVNAPFGQKIFLQCCLLQIVYGMWLSIGSRSGDGYRIMEMHGPGDLFWYLR